MHMSVESSAVHILQHSRCSNLHVARLLFTALVQSPNPSSHIIQNGKNGGGGGGGGDMLVALNASPERQTGKMYGKTSGIH